MAFKLVVLAVVVDHVFVADDAAFVVDEVPILLAPERLEGDVVDVDVVAQRNVIWSTEEVDSSLRIRVHSAGLTRESSTLRGM